MGEHGVDGLVTCTKTSGCDDSKKLDPKKCAATPACGAWIRGDALGCQSKCGVGEHSTDGPVTCSESTGCDDSKRPDAKKCATTPACGQWVSGNPSGCLSTCGVGEGASGSPGFVFCSSTLGCDDSQKPAGTPCPATAPCAPWIREHATECSEKCGLKYGESGVPGIVACSVTRKDGCGVDLKPEALGCPATASCEETTVYVSTTTYADSHNNDQHEQNEKVNFPGDNDASNEKVVPPLPQKGEDNGLLVAIIIGICSFVAVLIIVIVLVVVLRRRKNLKRNDKIQPSHSPYKQTQQDITKTKGPQTHGHRSRHRQSRGKVTEKDDLVVDHHDSTWQLSGQVDRRGEVVKVSLS